MNKRHDGHSNDKGNKGPHHPYCERDALTDTDEQKLKADRSNVEDNAHDERKPQGIGEQRNAEIVRSRKECIPGEQASDTQQYKDEEGYLQERQGRELSILPQHMDESTLLTE